MRIKDGIRYAPIKVIKVNDTISDEPYKIAILTQDVTVTLASVSATEARRCVIKVHEHYNTKSFQAFIAKKPDSVLYTRTALYLADVLTKSELNILSKCSTLRLFDLKVAFYKKMYEKTSVYAIRSFYSSVRKMDEIVSNYSSLVLINMRKALEPKIEHVNIVAPSRTKEVKSKDLFEMLEVVERNFIPEWTNNGTWISCIYDEESSFDKDENVFTIGQRHWINKRSWYTDEHTTLIKCKVRETGIITLQDGYKWHVKKGDIRYKLAHKNFLLSTQGKLAVAS